MNILTLSNCPADPALGSGYVVSGYAEAMRRAGHRVRVDEPATLAPGGAVFGRRAFRYRLALGMAWTALRAVRARYDVVELFGGDAWLAIRILKRRTGNRPLVIARSNGLETHATATSSSLTTAPRPWHLRHDRLFETGFRRADAIVTVSEWDRRWGLDAGYRPPDRLVAIENPLPTSYLGLPLDRARASKIVLYCGTWLPRKGIELIRSDMPIVLRSYPAWRFQLIGVGDGFDKRDHFPSEVWPQIEVIPQADRETRLRDLYRAAAIAIMPSIYDSFGLVAAEAMACGCALAASPVGFAASLRPNTECLWINGRERGTLEQTLRPLIENEELRFAIAAAGRERVQRLTWADACRRLVGLYETWLREKQ